MQALHNAGVVHRDVKPLNLVLAERERRFKLIDLGAAADLRNGTNWAPDESILDPSYCPPEQCAAPVDSGWPATPTSGRPWHIA
jgi:serine/threonine protein kinase